jgi:energy-coupling factor transporter transmembrane protein EcfT
MWILHFLPDALILWICNIVLLAGILLTTVAFFIKRIPIINQYRIPAQVLGIALLVAGVYWRGGYSIEMEWRERVAAVEAKVAAAEAASKEENTKIVTKVVTKTQIIRTRGETITKYVDREIVKYDEKFAPGGECEIPKEFIKALNDAAEAPK